MDGAADQYFDVHVSDKSPPITGYVASTAPALADLDMSLVATN